MHGVKVYLKSQREGLYYGLVLLLGGIHLPLAYLHHEEFPKDWLWILAFGLPGLTLILLSQIVRNKRQKALRYLPSMVILLSAAHILLRIASPESFPSSTNKALFIAIFCFSLLMALAGPLVVGTRFAYFSTRRIRLRYSIFKASEFTWKDVKHVQLEDDFLEIELKKGKDIRLVPSYKHTQHLRSYLDDISKKARAKVDLAEKKPEQGKKDKLETSLP